MHDTEKLYIVTRRDLEPGMQVAQSVHAAFEFARRQPTITKHWMDVSNNICVLAVDDEGKLFELIRNARLLELNLAVFREPDLENQVTAIAIEPSCDTARMVSNLALALN